MDFGAVNCELATKATSIIGTTNKIIQNLRDFSGMLTVASPIPYVGPFARAVNRFVKPVHKKMKRMLQKPLKKLEKYLVNPARCVCGAADNVKALHEYAGVAVQAMQFASTTSNKGVRIAVDALKGCAIMHVISPIARSTTVMFHSALKSKLFGGAAKILNAITGAVNFFLKYVFNDFAVNAMSLLGRIVNPFLNMFGIIWRFLSKKFRVCIWFFVKICFTFSVIDLIKALTSILKILFSPVLWVFEQLINTIMNPILNGLKSIFKKFIPFDACPHPCPMGSLVQVSSFVNSDYVSNFFSAEEFPEKLEEEERKAGIG